MTAPNLPDDYVRAALGRAAIGNADRLIQDAAALLESGSAPTAHSLAVLGLEEVGKAIACTLTDLDDDTTLTRQKFLGELRSHNAKLQRLRNFVDLLNAFIGFVASGGHITGMGESKETYAGRLKQAAQNDHVRKLRGFYVDLSDDDRVETPADVTDDEAREMISLATATAEACRTLLVEQETLQINLPD